MGGFSQGGAVAYELALSYPQRLAGLFALSTYYATAGSIQRSPANEGLPVFIGHGSHDPIVPEALGRAAVSTLEQQGYQPEYHRYGGAQCLPGGGPDLDAFCSRCLSGGVAQGDRSPRKHRAAHLEKPVAWSWGRVPSVLPAPGQ